MNAPFVRSGLELPCLLRDFGQRGGQQIKSSSVLFDLFVAFVLVHWESFSLKPFSIIQVAICTRESNPSLLRMRVAYVSTVFAPTVIAFAISRLDLPCAINAATSRSRSVNPPNFSFSETSLSAGSGSARA